MIRRPPRSTLSSSSAASDVYKRQALSWRSRPSRCSESWSFRAAVGSSRISSLTSLESALAISMSCCLPTPSRPTGVTGFSFRPTRSISAAASALDLFQPIGPAVPSRSLPRKMFSATDRYGTSASSWWMITIPRRSPSLIGWAGDHLPGPEGGHRRTGPQWIRPAGDTGCDLFCGEVARVDQERLDGVGVHDVYRQQEGRDDLDAVVVRLGVVRLRCVALKERLRHDDRLVGELAGVLEDRRELHAVDDQLDRGDLGILAGHDRQAGGDGVAGDAGAVPQRGDDAAGDAVVRREHTGQRGAVGVGRRQQVLHARLRGLLQPAQDVRLVDVHLAGRDDEGAVVEVGLEGVDRALPEEVRVVVVERAGEQLDVERAGGVANGAVLLEQAEADQQGRGLE